MACIILKFSTKCVYYHHSCKNKESFFFLVLKKKKKKTVKGFFIFMIMLSFKQVESNYGNREPREWDCGRNIKFFHCLNFGYFKYGIIII